MKKNKIALKPYLDTIAGYCDTLSTEALANIIIGLAKGIPTAERVNFLERIESLLPGGPPKPVFDLGPVEEILNEIQALRESIEERIKAIEDGSYWDYSDEWEDNSYYNEDPDYINEEQIEELESFFNDAENLFLDDRLEDARIVYGALFTLINEVGETSYFPPTPETDIREERARYCRCVYETSDKDKRFKEFATAMEINISVLFNENEYDKNYPLLQDVIDAKPDDMEDLESFLPAWKNLLSKKETKGRPAVLLLETVYRLEGLDGVSKLARKWKNSQPQGYLFWLKILKEEKDPEGIIKVSDEGLEAIKEGPFREDVAVFMIDAAEKLNDKKNILLGKRERFFSHINDQNLLELLDEAITQDAREKELDGGINFFKTRKTIDKKRKSLYAKTLLMAGELKAAHALVKNAKSVGWSYETNAGIVFGSVMSVLTGHSDKTSTIKRLLKSYANDTSVYSGRFSIDDGKSTSFYEEIVKGLKQKKFTKTQTSQYFSWAEKIGRNRIDHIVSNKHRNAYERAAQVLGSLAEAYASMDKKTEAVQILNEYYNEKYNRFSAFRREVKAVVMESDLLKNLRFL
ncbi:MAG: hypothetical protein JRI28_04450 [Deltaproteobacteria bacterium]|nr:hypothetical protein [Deltaproteobacteria bacterium]